MNITHTASQLGILGACSTTLFLLSLLWPAEASRRNLVDITFLAVARATERLAFLEATKAAGICDCIY